MSESSSGPAFVIGGLRGFMHTWFLWPCQSVGLGAPQTISRRPLPSPPSTSGLLGVYTYLRRILIFFTDFTFATFTQSCLKAVSMATFVTGGLRSPLRQAALVRCPLPSPPPTLTVTGIRLESGAREETGRFRDVKRCVATEDRTRVSGISLLRHNR